MSLENSSLASASEFGNTQICAILLDAGNNILLRNLLGADIHQDDDYALRWATVRNHVGTVQLLLSRGANIHAANDFSLRNAAKLLLYDMCETLLIAGADPFANESEAVSYAVSKADDRMLKMLIRHTGIKKIIARTKELDLELANIEALNTEE